MKNNDTNFNYLRTKNININLMYINLSKKKKHVGR